MAPGGRDVRRFLKLIKIDGKSFPKHTGMLISDYLNGLMKKNRFEKAFFYRKWLPKNAYVCPWVYKRKQQKKRTS